ncbi:patatin-like phospholipase family protein [uncultured Methylobacterium sp.]|jgi:NTE family protein|uniref:patatin-like phospholipase family protein n=1 Tax=uncultured Methylobacterium sp. TaxID=157278 RepID=UPI0026126D9F|nr:patatin-like phospholipase family protein [uncultured Methylobacterium sp.]
MTPRVALGLQGGGAFGAYGWGVIDRLLEEHVEVVAVSGASAGALNGAALVAGLAEGSDEAARAALERLWRATAERSPLSGLDWFGPYAPLLGPVVNRSLLTARELAAYVSPFVPSLRNMSVLRAVVAASIDMDRVARQERVPFFVSATDVLTGSAKVFTGREVTTDALMASACLPELFSAVEIGGRRYWDGGYAANPALDPLVFGGTGATDLIVVQLTPFETDSVGMLPAEMASRVSDISFNACLMRDLRTLVEMQRYARESDSQAPRMRAIADLNIHLLHAPCLLAGGKVSKLDTRWSTLSGLRDLGRATAERWLRGARDAIGTESTLVEFALS